MIELETLSNRMVDQAGDFTRYDFSYVSATSMTIGGDWTSLFKKGIKIELNNGGTRYGYINTSTYSSGTGLTTITLTTLNTTSASIVGLTNTTIDNVYIGAGALRSHPTYLRYNPTYTGFSVDPTGVVTFGIVNKLCIISSTMTAGTSNDTSFTMTVPLASGSLAGSHYGVPYQNVNNGTTETGRCGLALGASSSTLLVRRSTSAGTTFIDAGWTNTGNKSWWGYFTYYI